jgi:hypothetical protein
MRRPNLSIFNGRDAGLGRRALRSEEVVDGRCSRGCVADDGSSLPLLSLSSLAAVAARNDSEGLEVRE